MGETLFVHGNVTAENLGVVPGRPGRIGDVDGWIAALDAFYAASIDAFVTGRTAPDGSGLWQPLLAYQAPVPGTRQNQGSVIYARAADELGEPLLPPEHVVAALRAASIRRVVVGHTPSGDCPALVRDPSGFELVLADNSYGRVERGSRVIVGDDGVAFAGTTVLDSGEHADVATGPGDDPALGLRDATTGRLLKARLAGSGDAKSPGEGSGDAKSPGCRYLGFRALPGHRVEQVAIAASSVEPAALVPPRRQRNVA